MQRGKKRTLPFPLAFKTKWEEGPPDRRLLQIRVVHRRFFFRQFYSARDSERGARENKERIYFLFFYPLPFTYGK